MSYRHIMVTPKPILGFSWISYKKKMHLHRESLKELAKCFSSLWNS